MVDSATVKYLIKLDYSLAGSSFHFSRAFICQVWHAFHLNFTIWFSLLNLKSNFQKLYLVPRNSLVIGRKDPTKLTLLWNVNFTTDYQILSREKHTPLKFHVFYELLKWAIDALNFYLRSGKSKSLYYLEPCTKCFHWRNIYKQFVKHIILWEILSQIMIYFLFISLLAKILSDMHK